MAISVYLCVMFIISSGAFESPSLLLSCHTISLAYTNIHLYNNIIITLYRQWIVSYSGRHPSRGSQAICGEFCHVIAP